MIRTYLGKYQIDRSIIVARAKRSKKKDEAIGWDDVEFPKYDPRLTLWKEQTKLET